MQAEHCRLGLLSTPLCAPSTSARCILPPLSSRRRIVCARAQGEQGSGSSSSSSSSSSSNQQSPPPGSDAWWASLNKRSIRGPAPPAVDPEPRNSAEWNERRMGVKGYREFETIKREERQRVWDAMRAIARERYTRGEMPAWFRPAWLDIEEAPTNTFWRARGLEHYQQPNSAWDGDAAPQAGGGGDEGGNGGGGSGNGRKNNNGGGGGWWREEDPYWPLRDWGDHPMRWWTLAFAAALAAGGAWACARTGSGEAAFVGLGAGAALALCGGLMSDMRHGALGAAAVKAAWATCALLALREYYCGWQHKRGRRARRPRLEGTGLTAALMCALYMWTGMGGLAMYALPDNPGAAFKMADIARKSKIWDQWGYSNVEMRG